MLRFLKKLRARRNQAVEQKISEWNGPLEEQKVCLALDDNIAIIKGLFTDTDIIRYKEVLQNKEKGSFRYFLVFCDGMVNSEIINTNIVRPLMTIAPDPQGPLVDTLLSRVVQVGEAKKTVCFKELVESITFGDTVLFAEGCAEAMILNTKQPSLRSIEEPDNEKVLSGPREGFTESLIQNISQVIRRVHTNEFKTKMLTLGRRTRTSVCVCYFESLVDKSILNELLTRLNGIKIDGILDSNYITELIRDQTYSPFRTTGYTERPDVVVGKLLEGRIAIFVDGTPIVLTVPYLFIENFQSSEDYYFNFYYTSFARILRIGAFFLTVSVPALYIATVAFHQEMLPLSLLIRVAMERQSVPLPAAIEAVVMLLVFEILRETGVRMPSNVGQALSIVGALVIGQAAVDANLVAAPMIIVVAATGITSLVVPKLNAPIIFWRFLLLVMASAFGFFGLTIGLSMLAIHVGNLSSLGLEQISMTGNFRMQRIKDILVRAPWPVMIKRPKRLSMDETRQSGGDDND